MNRPSQDNQELLDDLLADSAADCGPSLDDIQSMVRQTKQRKRLTRLASASAAVAAVSIWLLAHYPTKTTHPPETASTPGIDIREIDDAQLHEIFRDAPTAVLTGANGEDILLVIEKPVHKIANSPYLTPPRVF